MNAFRAGATGALALILTLAAAGAAFAAPSTTDEMFAMKAAQAGMAEVADGKLAVRKTDNDQVRMVAQRMVDDHTRANMQLQRIAGMEGLAIPQHMDPQDYTMMTEMRAMGPRAFDRAYLRGQVTAHRQAIALFTNEANNGTDRRLVGFARNTLPILRHHLMMVRDALSSM
jgi:putative membrane protein